MSLTLIHDQRQIQFQTYVDRGAEDKVNFRAAVLVKSHHIPGYEKNYHRRHCQSVHGTSDTQ